jgi:predicted nucleic acid-binding protein
VIFVDTSAIYALADRADKNHAAAKRQFDAILARGESLLLHNYIVVESLALLQHRLGLAAASAFAKSLRSFEVEWISGDLHETATRRWLAGKRGLSFVDHVSFVVMKQREIEVAFAFDGDFEDEGFELTAD